MSERDIFSLLEVGETLDPIAAVEHGSQEWAYGFNIFNIANSTNTLGNSVLLDVEPKGAVEPVLISDAITLSVKALRGRGYAVSADVVTRDTPELRLLSPERLALSLGTGEAYYYLNPGEEDLLLRDDCTPAFQGHEELALTVPESNAQKPDGREIELPLAFWAAFGIFKDVPHEALHLRDQVIVGATYQGNHGIRYKVDYPLESAEGWEETGQVTPGVHYTQLDEGGRPAGTRWWRPEEEFLYDTESIEGQEVPKFSLISLPITQENLAIIAPNL